MMQKIEAIALVILLLSVCTSLYAFPATCQTQTATIRFTGHVAGECLLLYGEIAWGPVPSPIEWYGLVRGTARINGLAEATLFQMGTPYGNTYESEMLGARGSTSLAWSEGENKHRLIVQLRSTEHTRGVFAPDADFLTLPVGGDPAEKTLSFEGIHISDQGQQKIKGVALLGFTPSIVAPPSPSTLPGVLMILLEETNQKMFTVAWLYSDAAIPMGPGGPVILVPAATSLQAFVDIISAN